MDARPPATPPPLESVFFASSPAPPASLTIGPSLSFTRSGPFVTMAFAAVFVALLCDGSQDLDRRVADRVAQLGRQRDALVATLAGPRSLWSSAWSWTSSA